MKKTVQFIQMFSIALVLTACASKKYKEEFYSPSAKLIEIKKDTPIYSTWDRWSEEKSPILLVGKNSFLENASLADVLADDPDPQVVAKLKTYQNWQNAAMWTMLGGLVVAGASWPRKDKRLDGTEYETANWTILNLGLFAALVAPSLMHNFSLMYLEEAQGIHNGRINQQVTTLFQWSIK